MAPKSLQNELPEANRDLRILFCEKRAGVQAPRGFSNANASSEARAAKRQACRIALGPVSLAASRQEASIAAGLSHARYARALGRYGMGNVS